MRSRKAFPILLLVLANFSDAALAFELDFRDEAQLIEFDRLGNIVKRSVSRVILMDGSKVELGGGVGGLATNIVKCGQPDCAEIIKIAAKFNEKVQLEREIRDTEAIAKAGIRVAEIGERSDPTGRYLFKKRVPGKPIHKVSIEIQTSDVFISELVSMFLKAYDNRLNIDVRRPGNVLWSDQDVLVLVDTGLRHRHQPIRLESWEVDLLQSSEPVIKKFKEELAEQRGHSFVTALENESDACHWRKL